MGNHIVGNMFASGAAAIEPYIDNFSQAEAKDALNRIWEFVKDSYYFSDDAEFDDFTNPNEALGRLLAKVYAFNEYEKWKKIDWDKASDNLWKEAGQIYWDFKNDYSLC